METWVQQMVRTRSVRWVWASIAAVGAIVLFAAFQHRYVNNFVNGPFNMGQPELDSITDVSSAGHYFARVTGSKAIETGIKEMSRREGDKTGGSVSAVLTALVVGDRLLLVKSSQAGSTTARGELKTIPAEIDRLLFDTPAMEALRARFYPFYLDSSDFRFPGYVAIGAILSLAALIFWKGRPAWRFLRDPASDPLIRRVAQWGDPVTIAGEARREAMSPRLTSRGWRATDRYLIQYGFFSFNLLRWQDLLWGFKRVTKHRYNFVPVGKTFQAVLHCYGGSAEVKGSERNVDSMLAFAAGRAPWAVIGYSDEIQRLYTHDTAAFCATVENRKRDLEQRPAAPQPATIGAARLESADSFRV